MSGDSATRQATGFEIARAPHATEAIDPKWKDLKPLPGGRTGRPLFISNNPEIFETDGLLGGSVMPASTSAGSLEKPVASRSFVGSMPPLTDFGYYLFHINESGRTRRVHLLASTPGNRPVRTKVRGCMFANEWGLTKSSCVDTAKAMITKMPIDETIEIHPGKVASLGYIEVNNRGCVDGRFYIDADGPLIVRDVAAVAGASASVALAAGSSRFARGYIASPSPGNYGRCGGLYATDGWKGTLSATIDKTPFVEGFRFDADEEAAPAIAHYSDSDKSSRANYGSLYELDVVLHNGSGKDANVSVQFASYPGLLSPDEIKIFMERLAKQKLHTPTRLWDGPVAVDIDGRTEIRHAFTRPLNEFRIPSAGAMRAVLVTRKVLAGKGLRCKLRIPVPGLISSPAAIVIKATGPRAGIGELLRWPKLG
jgi:hypothetical protein